MYMKARLVILQLYVKQLTLFVDGRDHGSIQGLEERFRPFKLSRR